VGGVTCMEEVKKKWRMNKRIKKEE